MSTPTAYHRASIGEKQRQQRTAMAEPSVRCPRCETAVMPSYLMTHMAGCTDKPAVHPRARYLSRVQALHLATAPQLDAWQRAGLVRVHVDGLVAERDVVLLAAWSRVLCM